MRRLINLLHPIVLFLVFCIGTQAQSISIKEEIKSLDTYEFGKPNPVPIVSENPKITPYYKFEGYSHTSRKKDWKVVTLENDYIKVLVLPEIGGKIWGAIEKSTGEEFLYKNEVIKFRNIAMRGPWTSGGIEFNFGIIGHHPATATTVDYLTRTNKDGSVSCIVGNTDLPSRTNWTVEIRLEKDKAYFETNVSWYNASPLTQSYYNWMTAAAVATDDLEFFIPGNAYVEHNGNAHSWPIDTEGRNLSMYKNNNFGPSKSYHVVGEYNDFFGGYYHNSDFGFGQWALYEEMPGQKLWLWNLSREGGIWEDLLTDSDSQYIEFQAGRLFDQYASGAINPISQVGFDPYVMDRWHELWFPYKEIGGMVDASEHGVLNVEINKGETYIGLNALQELEKEIRVVVNGTLLFNERLNLKPMDVFSKTISAKASDTFEVFIDGTELSFSNDPKANVLKRPFYSDENLKVSQTEQLFSEGYEALKYREYDLAHQKLSELVQVDPSHQAGFVKLAELEYRRTNFDIALEHANTVLRMDTYHSGANYISGIAYRALNDTRNALESLGWAARDIKYRSVAYAQMAEIYLAEMNYKRARTYATKALDFNTYNINAREVLLLIHRVIQDREEFVKEADAILKPDPLNHFAALEVARMNNYADQSDIKAIEGIKNEFKEETILSVALRYKELGFDSEALLTLLVGHKSVKNELWKAYLYKDSKASESQRVLNKALSVPIELVFPYRRETVEVLEWAVSQNDHWKLKYYLAQNYLAVGLKDKGIAILKELGNTPDSDVFYRFRAKMLPANDKDPSTLQAQTDMEKALLLSASDWKVWEESILLSLKNKDYENAYRLSKKAYKKYGNNYNIGLAHAKSSLNTKRFSEVLKVLKKINVLPFELATESREIYERAHVGKALDLLLNKKYQKAITILEQSKKWPENIGVGKPYDPDERKQDFMLAMVFEKLEQPDKSKSLLKSITDYTLKTERKNTIDHLFGLLAAKKLNNDTVGSLLNHLEQFIGKNDVKGQTALALFKNDVSSLEKIKAMGVVPDDVWKTVQWAVKN